MVHKNLVHLLTHHRYFFLKEKLWLIIDFILTQVKFVVLQKLIYNFFPFYNSERAAI